MLMVRSMMGYGIMMSKWEEVSIIIRMVISMKVNGVMVSGKDMAYSKTIQEMYMRVIG